jgi:PAS domain S-box-containing protein
MAEKPTYGELEQRIKDLTDRRDAREALESQYRLMSTLLDNLQVGVFMVSAPSGKPLLANRRAKELLGRGIMNDTNRTTLAEVYKAYKLETNEFYPEDEMPIVRGIHGESHSVDDMVVVHPDGRKVRLEVFGSPVKDKMGNVVASLVSFTDITQEKQKEDALRESEEFLQGIFDAIQDGISVLDTDLNIVRVNRWMESMYVDEVPLVGKKCHKAYQKRETACPWCPTLKTVESGEPHSSVVPYPSKEDPVGWIDLSAFPLKDGDGNVVGIIEYVKDITKQKNIEKALQQSEQRYRSLVENTSDGYFVCEIPSGRFVFLNRRILDLFHFTMEEGLSLTLWDVVDPEEHELIRRRIQDRMGDEKAIFASNVYDAVRKDGSRFRAEVSSSLVSFEGKPVVQGVLRDVTKEEKLQMQVLHGQKMEAIGTLAGGIAHDFNNLLMGIQGRTSLMMVDMDSSHSHTEHLRGIEEYIKSASDLTKQLLGFARGGKYETKPTDLNDLVKKSAHMFGRAKKEVTIH